jgi:hypothetical protein
VYVKLTVFERLPQVRVEMGKMFSDGLIIQCFEKDGWWLPASLRIKQDLVKLKVCNYGLEWLQNTLKCKNIVHNTQINIYQLFLVENLLKLDVEIDPKRFWAEIKLCKFDPRWTTTSRYSCPQRTSTMHWSVYACRAQISMVQRPFNSSL